MPYIGNQNASEIIGDHQSYIGDGSRTVFGVLYNSNFVQVFQNGSKLDEGIDYSIHDSGTYITFTVAPESGDYVNLVGHNEITDLARSSYIRETFYATASQTQFNVVTNFSASDRVNVYLNGTRLSEIDYTLDDINNKVVFASGLSADDVVSIEIFVSGFRSSNHNSRGEKALHPVFATKDTVSNDLTIPSGENALLIGPVTLNSDITINGTLTIV